MEEELPPELRARRHAIYGRVTRRGRARRHRRLGAVFLAVAVVVAMPIVAVALNSTSDGHNQRIATFAPSTTGEVSTTSPTSTTPSSKVASTAPLLSTTSTQPSATTTSLVCRNSTNPACGPLSYDPPITNQAATLTATIEPATPIAGAIVTFTVHATDPDTSIDPGMFCGQVSFGEGNDTGCQVACAPNPPQYGPWAPPPPKAGDATFTMTHTYPSAGTYTARFSFTADDCGPRPSPASTSITVTISP